MVNGYDPILQYGMVIIRPRHAVFLVQSRTQGAAWKRLGGVDSELRSAMHSNCVCRLQATALSGLFVSPFSTNRHARDKKLCEPHYGYNCLVRRPLAMSHRHSMPW